MYRCTSLISAFHRIGFLFLAAAVVVGMASLPAQATPFHMVDTQTNTGDMTISLVSATPWNSGTRSFTLQASNTGTQTYNDVNLVEQFVWDADSGGTPQTALTYSNSNSWAGGGDNFSILSYSITGGPSSPPVPFLYTQSNTPLSWGNPPAQPMETVSSSDTFPSVPLGNFGPGATEDFTLVCTMNNFNPDVVGFYVAVPEPSTLILLAGGAGLLACVWRRAAKR